MIKFNIKGLKVLQNSIKRSKKQFLTFSEEVLIEFARKVSYEAQKNMRVRHGHLGKAPWYRNKNTGKHLRVASGKLRDSLRSIYDKRPNEDAVFVMKKLRSSISLEFGTKAQNTKGEGDIEGYPDFHESVLKRFPFFYQHVTDELAEKIMRAKIGKIRF